VAWIFFSYWPLPEHLLLERSIRAGPVVMWKHRGEEGGGGERGMKKNRQRNAKAIM